MSRHMNPIHSLIQQMESALGSVEKEAIVAKSYPTEETFSKERLWEEALQRLQSGNELTKTKRDIGPLIKDTLIHFELNYGDSIKEKIIHECFKIIKTEIVRGLPEWYSQSLLPPTPTVDPLEVVADVPTT